MTKYRFATSDWFHAVQDALDDTIRECGDVLGGQRLSITQRLINPPEDIVGPDCDELAWSLVIDRDRPLIIVAPDEAADYEEAVEFSAIEQNAKVVLDGSDIPTPEKTVLKGSLEDLSPGLGEVLFRLHNKIAAITA